MRKLSNESGQATVFMALFMGMVMIGFLAFAMDVGYFFHEKRMAQSAADAAAVAAAEELANGSTAETNAAKAAAKANGFDTTLATNPAVVTLTTQSSGNYSNAGSASSPSSWVQAVVSQPIHSFFMGAVNKGMQTLTISASATAGAGAATPTCICLTGTTGMDLNMSNDAQLSATSCQVTADSSSSNAIGIVGSANVCAKSLGAVSTNWDNSSNINNNGGMCTATKAVQGATPCSANLTVPSLPSGITCYANPINGWVLPGYTANYTLPMQNVTLTSGTVVNETATDNTICYSSLNLSDASSVTFSPGYTYYIEGNFTTGGGAPVSGSGVSFVITGNVDIANGVTVNLSAPTSNGVPGVLFYVEGATATIEGGSNSNFSGIFYAPNTAVTLDNGTGTTTDMDFVAQTLTMAGGAALDSFATPQLGDGGSGGAPILAQ
ncbi:MAG: pilus assembly protein TadG-related protein [Terracidiphilus sp.]